MLTVIKLIWQMCKCWSSKNRVWADRWEEKMKDGITGVFSGLRNLNLHELKYLLQNLLLQIYKRKNLSLEWSKSALSSSEHKSCDKQDNTCLYYTLTTVKRMWGHLFSLCPWNNSNRCHTFVRLQCQNKAACIRSNLKFLIQILSIFAADQKNVINKR